ncbi:MAG: DUF4143 domain-containing protein [Chlamydiae bacterium]|nr:DUF4143 domain-containing protein [Chlamydiota bacterium]MBI3276475.1 DUF4143 domain-containing protein [Chlamydiota bacterium]
MKIQYLWEWIWKGGYPELHAKGLKPERFYADYLVTYLERDIRQIIQVKNLRDFDRFLRLCATRTGQLISYSTLASDIGISPNTIKSWIGLLEASHVIYLLEPYYENLGKRIVKTPKIYFLDTGLASFLAGFQNPIDLMKSPLQGAFFETHVLGQMIRHLQNRGKTPALYFYRDHAGCEIDFVIPQGNALKLIEAKCASILPTQIKNFQEITQRVGKERIISQIVVSTLRDFREIGPSMYLDNSIELKSIVS